jgi:general secretion pathway protein D
MIWVLVPTSAEKSKSLYEKGREEEARQNYEAAYDDYQKAYLSHPDNLQYRAAATRTRFLAAGTKVHRGLLLRQAGRLEEALQQFQEAAAIDSSSPIASQELAATQKAIERAKSLPPRSKPLSTEVSSELQDAQGPIKLQPPSNIPITLKLSEDTKVVYQTVAKLAGLNVLFDPDYASRRVNIDLVGVTLTQALEALAVESKTFWHPLTPNTIFVASDNPTKRKELEQNVIKSFYLSNLTAPAEMQDLVNAIRTVLEVNRIQPLPSQAAIVVRGTPDQILLAEKLVSDFDRSRPEVVVDIAVMQVSRDKLHNLGITPPTSASVQLQSNASSSSNSTGTINLNKLANLNATDFTATISSVSAKALFSDSATKIIQNPQLRSVDGQKASLKIGDRVPTATGSSQSGISGVAVNSLVNTQFQYLDVGVNVDVTPHIHPDGEVTLKISMDVSSVTSYVTIGGIQEPVIGQRKVEHEIRLKDGEVSLLGGMLEQQETKSINGTPGLSQIPILKYLFSGTNTEVKDNEIVFALVPHVVREREYIELNNRTLDIGTASSIRLRHALHSSSGSGDGNEPHDSGDAATKQPGATVAALEFDPPTISIANGSKFEVNVTVSGAQDVYSLPLEVTYDAQGLQVLDVSNGGFLAQGDQAVTLLHRDDPSKGVLQVTASRPLGSTGIFGQGAVITLVVQARQTGRFSMKITGGTIIQPNMKTVPVSRSEMSIAVQ